MLPALVNLQKIYIAPPHPPWCEAGLEQSKCGLSIKEFRSVFSLLLRICEALPMPVAFSAIFVTVRKPDVFSRARGADSETSHCLWSSEN